MQDDLPGMEPLQIDARQQGVEGSGDHDDKGKRHTEIVQQLVRLVLLCECPNVEDKSRVSLTHFGGWKGKHITKFQTQLSCHL